MTEVIMPKMGDGMEEGTLNEWLKKDGDEVKFGEVIGSIQTDKATLELEASGSGTITGFLIKEGETVPVGKPIALLLKKGETMPADWMEGKGLGEAAGSSEPSVEPAVAPAVGAVKEVVGAVAAATTAVSSETSNGAGNRVKASPLAKKIAQETGVDLNNIEGTGPGGRITEKDVRSAPAKTGVASAPVVMAPAPILVAAAADTVVQLNRLRQIIAQRTTQSKQQVPHFYVTVEVDIEKMMQLRSLFESEGSGKVSVNDFVIKACAKALSEMPEVNSAFQDTSVIRYGGVHVGVAAAIDDGLLVPVIKDANQLSLRQIGAESKRLVQKARDGKLLPDEMNGSTFSVSNMGMLDVDNFIGIINQPNSAIIAISSARKKVVVGDDDEIEIRMRMNITGSFDHRVLDGAIGAKFMNLVKRYLENPSHLIG